MANSAGGARALERSLGRAGGVRAQPSSPEYVLVVRPLKGGTKLSRSICKVVRKKCNRVGAQRAQVFALCQSPREDNLVAYELYLAEKAIPYESYSKSLRTL